ncbi:ABC transporter permease [Balneolaceae bacterium YR4-1]|uniref:ABC transporter permease n=1 Tax=Halalkalibaculum roseum TaxID=2709311 RepID=A0A6M1SS32_9BACT|nr:ABC transporter permease [Halalkalibaculum roseum]NGP77889.1 ABC transporter permease [Halalkalibaculum roseum]
MKTTGFIARRYLFSKKHISLISTLTIISITGVTIGTALLIVVLSVFNGFFEVIKDILLTNDPDIRIESAEGKAFRYQQQVQGNEDGNMINYTEGMMPGLDEIPEVRAAEPFVTGKALLVYKQRRNRVVTIKGIQPANYKELNNLEESITSGAFDLGVQDRMPGLLMSEQLMNELGVQVGERIVLLSAEGMRKSLTQFSLPRTYQFEIRGGYSLTQIIDDAPVYVDLEAGQRLFDFRNTVSGIDVRLTDSDLAAAVKDTMHSKLGDNYKISTWYDLQRPLYDVMYLEKWGSYIILMIIVIVAVLNIIGSLTMIVIQKNRDIGVLLTMGYTPSDIKKIFVKQGLYIGLIGCVLGGGLGLLISWLQQTYGLIKLSSAFIISAYPVSIEVLDVSIVLAGSLLLCLAASWYPAKRAALVEPADAVRFE